MKMIKLIKSDKVFKEIPWTVEDEKFFRDNEGYMISEGMELVITGSEEQIQDNSFVATALYFGKSKTDGRSGVEVRWVKMIVKESSIPCVEPNAELWIKIPVSKIETYFPNGTPHDYVVVNPRGLGRGMWKIGRASCRERV